jgi:hypothetical protein
VKRELSQYRELYFWEEKLSKNLGVVEVESYKAG